MKPVENRAGNRRRRLWSRPRNAESAAADGRERQPAWFGTTLVVNAKRTLVPKLVEITDGVCSADGYAFSNMFFVITDRSVVVIDTTESMAAARAALRDFRKMSALPISHLIYTHYHADHTGAAEAIREPQTKIISQRLLPQQIARKELFLPYRRRVAEHHFSRFPHARTPGAPMRSSHRHYITPDVTFDEGYCFEEGGVAFELVHAPGETVDHTVVWLPQKRVLFPADLYYGRFPMLSSPMKRDRPVATWADSIERMRALRAEHLVPSHCPAVHGADEIDRRLADHARAIRQVHDETVKCINAGKTVEQAMRVVKLSDDLAPLPYLWQTYGKVSWAIRGIYRQYTGWCSFNPTELNPNPESTRHRELMQICGGPAPILERAEKALLNKRDQLALELADVVLGGQPGNRRAIRVQFAALQGLAAAAGSNVERNLYRNAARAARAKLKPAGRGARPQNAVTPTITRKSRINRENGPL
jgi:alkyl sulfatase BDS1-like metallo-beta-lactamase superfamily hydrolase